MEHNYTLFSLKHCITSQVVCPLLFLSLLVCFYPNKVNAQAIVVDNAAAKVRIVTASGTLDPATLNYARNPMALGIDSVNTSNVFSRKILLSWFINVDNAGPEPMHKRMTSLNGGSTWGAITGGTAANNIYFGSAIKLKSGKLIAIEFRPTYVLPSGNLTYPFEYYTSTNNGDTWTKFTNGLVDFSPLKVNGMRFHKGVIEDSDGTLYASAYIWYTPAADNPCRTYILKSIDKGITWKPMPNSSSPLAVASNTDESTLARCKDGSWLIVMRQVSPIDVYLPLLYSRSYDKGVSWSTPAQLPGLGSAVKSIDPKLMLMPNGVMVLSYGRPDQRLAFSPDGNGTNWSTSIITYTDAGETHPTSANSAIVALGHDRLVQFGDYYGATFNPNTQGIWRKEIGVMRPNLINRVDLNAKYASGAITVSTDMAYTTATHREARIAGAFDASTDYWSGAFKMATSGYYTIDMQQPKTYNSIGICLGNGLVQSATVKYSLDNITWSTLKTYSSETHYTIDHTITGNFTARYIRVDVTSPSPIVSLNEIQLFSPDNTFEDNVLNAVPYGYSAPNYGFWVSEGVTPPTGYQSARALYMEDVSSTDKVISKTGFSPYTTKTLEFMLKPIALGSSGGAIQFRITSGATIAFRVRTISGGAVQYYNGTSYVTISGATIATGAWTKVKIVANASGSGTISLNGGAALPIGKENAVSNMDGFAFASGGGAATGDKALFDDVNFYGLTSGNQTSSVSENNSIVNDQRLIIQEYPLVNQNLGISISPNPANEMVTLIVKNASEGKFNIYFFDMSGRKIKTLHLMSNGSTSAWNIPVQELLPGVYTITIEQGNHIGQTKLIKTLAGAGPN